MSDSKLPPDWKDPNNPFRRGGLVHESEVCELFGYSAEYYRQKIRMGIPGRNTPNGRFHHISHLVEWLSDDKSEDRPNLP